MIGAQTQTNLKNDRVLNTYNVLGTNYICYDTSGFFSPIAIRDQIIRVCLILERAKFHGIISSERPLLIVGGGIAGITAAMKAKEMGVDFVLVEKRKVYNVLIKSMRYFCPIQYDWAVDHWDLGVFPWGEAEESSIPLLISEGSVGMVIEELKEMTDFPEEEVITTPNIYDSIYENVKMESYEIIHENTDNTSEPVNDEEKDETLSILRVTEFRKYSDDDTPEDKIKIPSVTNFGMGLSCTGFGKERVSISSSEFRGYGFWTLTDHSDFLTDGNLLICGSGDGSLQDFLLFTTQKKTAKEVYKFLRENEDQATEALFDGIEKNIRFAEEEAKRQEIWQNSKKEPDKKQLCRTYSKLHKRHAIEVDKLLNSQFVTDKLEQLVTVPAIQGQIKVSYLCNHFSASYPFNRFLALLIGKFIDSKNSPENSVFLEKTSVNNIFPDEAVKDAHECKRDPIDCANYPHKVLLAKSCTCENINENDELNEETYRRIIIRYGILNVKGVFGEPNIPGVQILPYTLDKFE